MVVAAAFFHKLAVLDLGNAALSGSSSSPSGAGASSAGASSADAGAITGPAGTSDARFDVDDGVGKELRADESSLGAHSFEALFTGGAAT
jgi:hypothetical protein